MKSRIILVLLFLTSVVALSLTMASAPPAAAAVGATYTVTSPNCTGPGSITEAMALANANPGTDTISITPGLQIQAKQCLLGYSGPGQDYFMLQATESVNIEGNGARLVGSIVWITSGGLVTPIGPSASCPGSIRTDKIIALTPGFIKVGTIGQDNSAINVTVRELDMFELNSVARIEKNATLILEDLNLERIIASYKQCFYTAIDAQEGANFTARRTAWDTIWNGAIEGFTAPDTTLAAIVGIQGPLDNRTYAGNLTVEDSTFKDVYKGTIHWGGQTGDNVNIVTSRFYYSGGVHVEGESESNIVNSILSSSLTGGVQVTDYLLNTSNEEMNIKASTILFPSVECDIVCQSHGIGLIYHKPGKGKINFIQSAVGINFVTSTSPPFTPLLDPGDGTGFTADEYTWIQPTPLQDAAALKTATNQTNLLTDPPGLPIEGSFTIPQWATPLDPGELIDTVPDAACGQANTLLNPIDGTCITVDALGNPRVDANDKRNTGAVQLTLAPHLTVTATGDQTVDLSWTKPQFSDPATGIFGYQLRYRETGAGSWTTLPPVPGPDNLSVQASGLTNGQEYEFEVRATYSPSGEGPWSNTATGTPLGPIGAPVVTTTPGNGQVDLSWTKPADGGHVIDAYSILWRPVGTTDWIGAAGTFGTDTNPPATQTTITGLTNGTEYEFAVTANASNGDISPQGTVKATPFAPGTVIIAKFTFPTGGTGFNFTQDIDNSGGFTLGSSGIKVFDDVEPGTYTVMEEDPQSLGYQLKNIGCFDDDPNGVASTGDVATRTATINVDSGETVNCAFSNSEEETIVIEKRTLPPGGSGFTFSDDIAAPNSFSLDDAQMQTFNNVPQGSYQVAEDKVPGYVVTAIDCTVEGVSVPGDLNTRTATINLLQPGGRAYCTFTNTELGTIIMRKETLPGGATEAFGYTISGSDHGGSGTLTDGDAKQVGNAKPGKWTLAESLPSADWHLGDISCTSTLGTSMITKDVDNLKATVDLAPGDTVDCTFTNVEDDTITVEKVTVPAGDTTTSFGFTGSGSIGGFTLKDGEKQSFSVDAAAGPYTLTEADPSGVGYEVTDIRCVNSQTGDVTLGDPFTRSVELDAQPGESQHCTFTNERHGQVVIRKATAPGGGTGFGFYGSFGSFSLDDGQEETFLDVTPGAYSVSEVDPTNLGYGLSGISCSDSDPNGIASTGDLATHTAAITLDAGETVECTFTNSKSGSTDTYLPVIGALWPEIKPPPESCRNIVGNSGFEDNSSWVLETTEYTAAYTISKQHTGARSVRTGITDQSSNIFSYSSAMQTVTIPQYATKAGLRYYIYPQSTETMAFKTPARALEIMQHQSATASDIQLVLILDLNNNELARLYDERRNDRAWLLGTHDLLNFKGQTVKLYFGTFNNGRWNQGVTAMYVDDVSLEVCAPN